MDRDGFAFLPYEQLKKVSPVDQPFDYDEVASITGPEYAQHMDRDGIAALSYEEFKKAGTIPAKTKKESTADPVKGQVKSGTRAQVLKNILVVDDEVSVNNNIRKILGKNGFQVDQATSKDEAVEKINQLNYSLVLLDLRMPGVSGLELLQTIARTQPFARVIIITGYASIETAIESARIGAVDYLPKPFTPDELRNVAERAYAIAV
jgi:CheY-like chemotaxis protein